MVNPLFMITGRKDRGSREPGAPLVVPPPQEVRTCPGTHHGSSDMLLNTLLGMQQQQQQQMALLQQQLAAQQQQIELQQRQQSRPYFLELKEAHAPTFDGSTGLLEAEKWITEMEKFFRALCIPKDEWVNVTIPFLIADAEAWFNAVIPTYESGRRRINWAQFLDIFYLNYTPATFRIEKENEFFNLKQGSMTVIQYASMFKQLGRFVPAFMVHEQNKITKFKKGLNLNLLECMETATTYQELIEQATRAERLIRERNQIRDSKRPRPWNEQYEESESAVNKKAKAIQEDLSGSNVHGQDDEKQIEALHKRIIQLEKDLDQKQSLQLYVEYLQGQLDIMKHTDTEILKEAEKLQKMLIEKETELEHQTKQKEALHKRTVQFEKDFYKKKALQLDIDRLKDELYINQMATNEECDIAFRKIEEKQQKLWSLLKEDLLFPQCYVRKVYYVNGKPEGVLCCIE